MDASEVQVTVAAVVSTLFDLGNPISPASSIYLALGMDIRKYEIIAEVLKTAGLATVTAETIQLTEAGNILGRKCSELLATA